MKKMIGFAAMAVLIGCSAASNEAAPPMDVNAALPDVQGAHMWKIDKAPTLSVQATASNSDYNVRQFTAEMNNFAVAVNFNPDDLSAAKIAAIVDMSSVRLADELRANNWNEPDWLATAAHPAAVFTSSHISKTAEGTYRADGELALKGETKPAALIFTLIVEGDQAKAKGEMVLNRMDFAVGTGSDFETEENVHFEVKILMDITASRK